MPNKFLLGLSAGLLALSSKVYAAPIIFHGPPTAHAGDVFALQGDSFGSNPQVQYSYNSTAWTALTTLTHTMNFVTVKLPMAGQLTTDLVTVRVSADGSTWSPAFFINRAHGMHFDTPEVAPSSPFRIFGRNLKYGTPTVRFFDVNDPALMTPFNASVDVANSTQYVLKVTAPSGIVAGHPYNVYVGNGLNGQGAYGSGETKVDKTLLARIAGTDCWNLGVPWGADFNAFYNNVYNVKTQYGAYGDGVHNDQAAIQAAITAAGNSANGGVVYLPAGTYRLDYDPSSSNWGLLMPSRVVLAGAGINQTTLKYGYGAWSSYSGGWALGMGNGWDPVSKCGIADLTIQNVNTDGKWNHNLLIFPQNGQKTSEVFLQRVRLQIGSEQMRMQHIDKMVVANSDFEMLGSASYVVAWLGITDLTNYLYNGNIIHWSGGGAATFNNSTEGVVENNHFTRDCNYSLYPNIENTRVFDNNFDTNLAIINNTCDVTGGSPDQTHYDGETILTEGGGSNRGDEMAGAVTGAASGTLQDSSRTWGAFIRPNGVAVAIVAGVGTGQWRFISGLADSHTLQIDHPWDVTPTSGSRYSVFDWCATNWLVLNNTLSGNAHGILFYTASTHDVAIVGNALTDNDGIELRPDQFPDQNLNDAPARQMLIWDTQVVGNTVTDVSGVTPAYIGVLGVQWYTRPTLGTVGLGIEIRNNTVNAHTPNISTQGNELGKEGFYNYWKTEGVKDWAETSPPVPGILGTIFQNNTAGNCDKAFYLSTGSYGTLLIDTTIRGSGALVQDDYLKGAAHASVGTLVITSATPPSSPTGVTARAYSGQIALSWTSVSGATSYNVYRGTAAGGESATAITTGITDSSYTNTGLVNGTAYYYTVKAINASGTSSASSEVTGMPLAVPIGRVISFLALANGQYVCADIGGANPLIANRTAVGIWEQFTVQNAGSGNVYLKASANNKYVSAVNATAPLIADHTTPGLSETFRWIDQGNGQVSLQALSNSEYVCADNAGSSPLVANRTYTALYETFQWTAY